MSFPRNARNVVMATVMISAAVGCASDGSTPPAQTAIDSTKVPTDTARPARQAGTYALVDVNDAIGTDSPVHFNDRGDILTSGTSKRVVSAGQSVAPPAECLAYSFNNLGHALCGLDQKFSATSYALWNGSALVPLTGLDTFPASGFMALALNDSDAVAGTFQLPTFANAGCSSGSSACVAIWRGGKVTFPGAPARYVSHVNNRFDLLLQDPIPTPFDPVSIFFAATKATRSITGNPGYVSEMNDSGWVAGALVASNTRQSTAFVNTSGSTIILGSGVASGINNLGVVVGTIDSGAFMWKAGTKTFLTYAPANTLWTVKSALKINNRGQILARADNAMETLTTHWVVLTPITP